MFVNNGNPIRDRVRNQSVDLKRLLGLSTLCKVCPDAYRPDEVTLTVLYGGGVVHAIPARTIRSRQPDLIPPRLAQSPGSDLIAQHLQVRAVEELVDAMAHNLLATATKQRTQRRVDIGRHTIGVNEPETLFSVLKQ